MSRDDFTKYKFECLASLEDQKLLPKLRDCLQVIAFIVDVLDQSAADEKQELLETLKNAQVQIKAILKKEIVVDANQEPSNPINNGSRGANYNRLRNVYSDAGGKSIRGR